jgi:hypothetical protein
MNHLSKRQQRMVLVVEGEGKRREEKGEVEAW